eukprot:2922139-Rhodomonas_salina.5
MACGGGRDVPAGGELGPTADSQRCSHQTLAQYRTVRALYASSVPDSGGRGRLEWEPYAASVPDIAYAGRFITSHDLASYLTAHGVAGARGIHRLAQHIRFARKGGEERGRERRSAHGWDISGRKRQ